MIGATDVSRAVPGGHTLLLAPPPFVITQFAYPNLPYDPVRDFRPVALLVVSENAILVRAGLPARDLALARLLFAALPAALAAVLLRHRPPLWKQCSNGNRRSAVFAPQVPSWSH